MPYFFLAGKKYGSCPLEDDIPEDDMGVGNGKPS